MANNEDKINKDMSTLESLVEMIRESVFYLGAFSQGFAEWFIKVYSNPRDT